MENSAPAIGAPCWIELSTSDVPAAKTFYGELFGWDARTDARPEAGGYTMAHLDGAAVAAMSPLYQPAQPTAWTVSFAAAGVDDAVAAVTAASGTVLVKPMDVFDLGRFAVVADPEGAVFSLWQARAFAGAERMGEPGTLGWVELATRDARGALAFYRDALGWTAETSPQYTHWSLGGTHFGGMVEMGDRLPPDAPAHWLPYFAVTDVDATAATALRAGGTALLAPTSVPDGPRIAVLNDPQGAVFGIHRG